MIASADGAEVLEPSALRFLDDLVGLGCTPDDGLNYASARGSIGVDDLRGIDVDSAVASGIRLSVDIEVEMWRAELRGQPGGGYSIIDNRRRGLVHRPRLVGRFVSGDQPALTLVSAPAGFGKTTLLTDWVADGERPTAWLSLDARDNDPALFWSYLIAAVQVAVPGVGDAASSLLQSDPSARDLNRELMAKLNARRA